MWWAFVPMLLWLAWHWLTTRDWRAGAVWMAFIAGWLVWFQNLEADGVPVLHGAARAVPDHRPDAGAGRDARPGAAARTPSRSEHARAPAPAPLGRRRGVERYLALVVADFAWMWPLFTGGLLTYDEWHAHMWLPSWV